MRLSHDWNNFGSQLLLEPYPDYSPMQNNLWVWEKGIRKLASNCTLKENALIRDYIVLMYLFTSTNNFTHKCSTREEWKVSRFLKPLRGIATRGQGTQQIKHDLEISGNCTPPTVRVVSNIFSAIFSKFFLIFFFRWKTLY